MLGSRTALRSITGTGKTEKDSEDRQRTYFVSCTVSCDAVFRRLLFCLAFGLRRLGPSRTLDLRFAILHLGPSLAQDSGEVRRVLATSSQQDDDVPSSGNYDFPNGSSSSEARTGAAVYWDNTAMVGNGAIHRETPVAASESTGAFMSTEFSFSEVQAIVCVMCGLLDFLFNEISTLENRLDVSARRSLEARCRAIRAPGIKTTLHHVKLEENVHFPQSA